MIGAGDDEVDGAAVGEEVVEAELDAAGWGAIGDYDPVIVVVGSSGRILLEGFIPCAITAEGSWWDIGGCEGGFD